jgi:hypothetical protein
MPLFRQGPKRFGQHPQLFHHESELPRLRAEKPSLGPHDISHIQALKYLQASFVHLVSPEVSLNSPGSVLDVKKSCLPKITQTHQASGQGEARF